MRAAYSVPADSPKGPTSYLRTPPVSGHGKVPRCHECRGLKVDVKQWVAVVPDTSDISAAPAQCYIAPREYNLVCDSMDRDVSCSEIRERPFRIVQ